MNVYYAHCIAIYNTLQESRDVSLLEDVGFTVINPNNPQVQARCDEIKTRFKNDQLYGFWDPQRNQQQPRLTGFLDAGEAIMKLVFEPIVRSASVVAFRALPDGRIPAGVQQELLWARDAGARFLELPSNVLGRGMTIANTREYLREIGVR